MRKQTVLGIVLAVASGALAVQACGPTSSTCDELRTCGGGEAGESAAGNSGTGTSGGSNTGGSSSGSDGKAGGGGKAGASGSSGGDSGSGNAGSAGAPPCDGACGGATAACVASTNTCVECIDNSTCKSPKAACDTATNKCVECTDKSTCKAPKPACDVTKDACVECTAKTDCTDGTKPFCDTTAEKCVACLQQSDCTSPTASACNAGTCGACTKDADCANIVGKGVCNAGTCVQCTTAKEAVCAGKSCNPQTSTCTTTPVGTLDYCQACTADSECIGGNQSDPDARCVPMKYMGVARAGGFCLRRVVKACARPYSQMPTALSSLSGAVAEAYCGIDQDATRCEAVLDLVNAQSCADGNDTSCGCSRDKAGVCTELGKGGLCKTVLGAANQCTIPCGTVSQCPNNTNFVCPGSAPYCH